MHGRGREYSFWAGSGEIMDLTEEHRVKAENRLHLLVVDGPTEPKKMFPYMEPLIEQMKLLNWKCGYVVADLPAVCKIANHQSKGYHGCPWCWQNPKRNFDRMSWLTMENAASKTDYEYKYLGEIGTGVFHGKSVLLEWTDSITQVLFPDYMHTITNIAEHYIDLFKGQRKLKLIQNLSQPKKSDIKEKREKEREKRKQKTIERKGRPQVLSGEALQRQKEREQQKINELYDKAIEEWNIKQLSIDQENERRRQENKAMAAFEIDEKHFSELNLEWKEWCSRNEHACTTVPFTSKSKTGTKHMNSDDWIKWLKFQSSGSATLARILPADVLLSFQQVSSLAKKIDVSVH